jgi:hypothetical protein
VLIERTIIGYDFGLFEFCSELIHFRLRPKLL